jgi:hypothetical protein
MCACAQWLICRALAYEASLLTFVIVIAVVVVVVAAMRRDMNARLR